MSSSSLSEREWPIELYRFTCSEGWQKNDAATQLSACARKDCIVIPALRQKFTLRSSGEKSRVIRRNSCLLLVSRRKTRAMLLKFQSLQDCLEFSDLFVSLNNDSATIQDEEGDYGQQQDPTLPTATDQDREQAISYLVQLLHDEDFRSLVQKLDNFVANTQDGELLFNDLEEQEF